MESPFYEAEKLERVLLTLQSISETLRNLMDWNSCIGNTDDYYSSQNGMQLLAANCTLLTAIGEGINRINRILPDFLSSNFSETPWSDIIGMRNRIAHGYFELDADIVFDVIKNDIPSLAETIQKAIDLCMNKD